MKLISFAIPSYNSAAYMENCIKSILPGGEDVEIIVVNDGSTKDNTAEIADRYAKEYPTIVKAVHQENGGHGQAVNSGLKNATGKYFKVVDSDDWVDLKSLKEIIKTLKSFDESSEPDMLIANYVYEKQGAKRKKVVHYRNVFPTNKLFGWDDMIGKFKIDQYILMHSVIYKTEVLKKCGLELPKHTFYVDNIFVFEPLPNVHKMYYMDVNFYRYFIGRDDQSVNETVMISRIDQQLRVNKRMVDFFDQAKIENRNCRLYMRNYLRIMMEISSIFLIISGTKENLAKKKELWQYVKNKNKKLYNTLRHSLLGFSVNIPTPVGRWISKKGYKVANKLIGFN